MQGVNRIYAALATEEGYTTQEYFNELKTIFDKAFAGWGLTTTVGEFEVSVTNGAVKIFTFRCDNETTTKTLYLDIWCNDNNTMTSLTMSFFIHSVAYSSRFIGFQFMYYRDDDTLSMPMFIARSDTGNIVFLFPLISSYTDKSSLYTSLYSSSGYTKRNVVALTKLSAGCPEASSPETNMVYNDVRSYPIGQKNGSYMQQPLTMIPIGVTNSTERILNTYYINSNSFSLSNETETILEINKDFYFTNGVIAFKLT
jgi:hypothetical protein